MKSGSELKKIYIKIFIIIIIIIKSSCIYCSPYFLFGEKMLLNCTCKC